MDPAGSPAAALRAMIAGYEAAQTIYVAARLDLADLIARGMTSSRELAEATGSDEGALHRVLRALASLGVLKDVGDRRFELTERGRCLQAAAPGSVRAAALLAGERSYRAWGGLLHSVQSGQTAFERVFGMGTFEYMTQNPAVRAIYDDAMSASSASRAAGVVGAYDFSPFRVVADVGGGHGTLLAAILRANPGVKGILFERPSLAAGMDRLLGDAGVGARCQVVTGDFFQSVPAGADAYVLSHIIHNWDDERSAVILRNCRAAMAPAGRLLLLEQVLPERVEASEAGQRGVMADLHMMVITGGRERTEKEYSVLLSSAGFRLRRVIGTPVAESVIEAVPG